MIKSFKVNPDFFLFANDLQIARSLCILPILMPVNIYEYFNSDLKIFSFELPGLPLAVKNWFYQDFSHFQINEKFLKYGI